MWASFFFSPHTFRNPEYLCVLEGVHDEDGEAQSKDVGKEAGVEIRSAVLLQTAGGEKIQNVILPHCDPTRDRAGAGARTWRRNAEAKRWRSLGWRCLPDPAWRSCLPEGLSPASPEETPLRQTQKNKNQIRYRSYLNHFKYFQISLHF